MSKIGNKIEKAFDEGTLNSDQVYLNEEQVNTFVDDIVDQSSLANLVRTKTVDKSVVPVSRIIDQGPFLKPGAHDSNLNESTEFGTEQIEYKTEVVRGKVHLNDDELNDNLEGEAFEDHLMSMISKKIANEIDMAMYAGRKVENPNKAEGIMGLFNGIKYHAENHAENVVDATVDDFADREISKDKLKKTMRKLKKKYRTNMEWLMNVDANIEYQDLYNTVDKQGQDIRVKAYSKYINEIPLMDVDEPVSDGVADATVNAVSEAGQNAISVDDETNFKIGQDIVVNKGTAYERTYRITNVSTGTLEIENDIDRYTGLLYDLKVDDTVETCTLDGNSVIATNPKNVLYIIQDDMIVEPERIPAVGTNFHYKGRMTIGVENKNAMAMLTNLKAS